MPIRITCSECGELLLEDDGIRLYGSGDNVWKRKKTWLEKKIEEIGGICPSCGHILENPPVEVKVMTKKEFEKNG